MSQQQAFIEHIQQGLMADQRIKALFLTGSFGRRTADAYSDVDLLLIAEAADQPDLIATWKELAGAFEPIVHSYQPPFQPVHCIVTEGWLRSDLAVPPGDPLRGLTQDRCLPLIDRDNVYSTLPARLEARPVDPVRVERLTREFLRVLGLMHVVLGRGEVELMASDGCYLLRRMLVELLSIEVNLPDPGGILHLSRVLDADRLALLAALPLPELSSESAIATNFRLAGAFLPRARALHARLGIDWPDAFEAATRKRLEAAMPPGIAVAF